MPHGCNSIFETSFPNVTNRGEERFIGEIDEGTLIGYKYFSFRQVCGIGVTARAETALNGVLEIRLSEKGEPAAVISLAQLGDQWKEYTTEIDVTDGVYPVYFVYHGSGTIQLKEIFFIEKSGREENVSG